MRSQGLHLLLLLPIAAAAVVAACKQTESVPEDVTPDGGEVTAPPPTEEGNEPASNDPPTGNAGTGAATGLPCDVQSIIESRCIACHSGTTPPPLLKYEDLAAKSKKDPTKTMAQASLDLMKANQMPPAPAVAPEDDEIAAFEAWVTGGTAKNKEACTDPPPADETGDGGITIDGGADAGGSKCTSGKTWTQGNTGGALMNPGNACNACHATNGGPNLRIAGTVFPSLHEPNNCIGSAPPPQLTLTITDSRRGQPRKITMLVNASGNFSTRERFTPPITATISDGTNTRSMKGKVNSGDCNSCHTEAGINGAPGRIQAPTAP